ncbi:Protein of unknown function [Singulisphaera sp. GP187]|uniref:ribosomal maturation YjgA family protein n=1 Tax=Singulisphaera sp. GP187 TaxID=1882752 RepID=UPI00092BD118|nr:DUF2809 domain-containing protein [Singulisphaera sp. GP187]SIN99844.1 Protein of unknown function [Singulisphaera sp. GP187]
MDRPRSRSRLFLAAILVVGLGLGSRRFAEFLPQPIRLYAGDILWALLVYLGLIFVRPSLSRSMAGTLALSFALLIEISQLYHAPWIDSLRANPLGGLVLGFGFLWSDLVCYGVGVSLGLLLDKALRRHLPKPSHARSVAE